MKGCSGKGTSILSGEAPQHRQEWFHDPVGEIFDGLINKLTLEGHAEEEVLLFQIGDSEKLSSDRRIISRLPLHMTMNSEFVLRSLKLNSVTSKVGTSSSTFVTERTPEAQSCPWKGGSSYIKLAGCLEPAGLCWMQAQEKCQVLIPEEKEPVMRRRRKQRRPDVRWRL